MRSERRILYPSLRSRAVRGTPVLPLLLVRSSRLGRRLGCSSVGTMPALRCGSCSLSQHAAHDCARCPGPGPTPFSSHRDTHDALCPQRGASEETDRDGRLGLVRLRAGLVYPCTAAKAVHTGTQARARIHSAFFVDFAGGAGPREVGTMVRNEGWSEAQSAVRASLPFPSLPCVGSKRCATVRTARRRPLVACGRGRGR